MEKFAGDKKVGEAFLDRYEIKFINWMVPKIPLWIRTYHLTMLTLPISALIIFFCFLAKDNINWLWAVSVLIIFQWYTDTIDGTLGKYQGEGLVRWGYYMDHLLDYFFLCAILIGYSLMLDDEFKYLLFFILALFGAFMVNSFLSFAASNNFRVAYFGFGPTEVRIVFLLANSAIAFFGIKYLIIALPYVLFLGIIGLVIVIFSTQKELWQIDKAKNADSN